MHLHLKNLRFHSFHGLYEEERLLGNDYEINVDIEVEQQERVETIGQTVNYVSVYDVIKTRMEFAEPLLETLAYDMIESIHLLDKRIKHIALSIDKLHPPVENFQGSVGVSFSKSFI